MCLLLSKRAFCFFMSLQFKKYPKKVAVVAGIILFLICIPFRFGYKKIYAKNNHYRVCIAMIDDRFTENDFNIAKANTMEEFTLLLQNTTNEQLEFTQLNMRINKLYALRQNYKLFLSDMSEYAEFMSKYPERHSVWLKPNFILDIMNNNPHCDWVSFMDSDAHFWMDRHKTSLDDFFSSATMMEASHPYEEFEYQKRKNNGYYAWKDQKHYFIIGTNGIYQHGQGIGWPLAIHSTAVDAACAGVFLVKNCEKGREMIEEWIYGPKNANQEVLDQYQRFAQEWAREQSILNRIIIPRHTEFTAYYSFRDFVDPDNSAIRHIWTSWKKGRVVLALKNLNILLLE
jgi:hypothetical protein